MLEAKILMEHPGSSLEKKHPKGNMDLAHQISEGIKDYLIAIWSIHGVVLPIS